MRQTGESFARKHGEKLYHYTTLPALMGMLESKTFWLGNVASMNDRSEARDFIDKLRGAVMKSVDPAKQLECEQAFGQIYKKLENSSPFAMSLSTLREDAAQWERYAHNAKGVCLVLNTKLLYELLHGYQNLVFEEVFYDYDIYDNDFCRLMIEYVNTGTASRFKNAFGAFDFDLMAHSLILTANLHKNSSFASEDEIRMLAANPLPRTANVGFKYMDGVIRQICEFRVGERCAEKGVMFEDLFDQIIIGPRSYQRLPDLKGYVQSLGYRRLHERLAVSDCPLR